jgi:disulfide bond formation protein DsbB
MVIDQRTLVFQEAAPSFLNGRVLKLDYQSVPKRRNAKLKRFFNKLILEHGPAASWALSVIATLGSLYFSEVRGFIPCTYCWFSRILMYPLVVILGIAAVRKDYGQAVYVLPLTIMGMGMAGFHYLTQKTTLFAHAGNSCGIVPCNVEYINWLGFITIPFLALVAFTGITILQILILRAFRSQ